MRKVAVVIVALLGLVALPMRAPTSEMTGMTGIGGVADTACRTIDCPSMPLPAGCLTVCIAVVALVGGVAVGRPSLVSGRVRVASSAFVDQLAGSSIFRPPRLT